MLVFMKNGTEKRTNGTKNGRAGAEQVDGFYFRARR
jgi:hypothetical protein